MTIILALDLASQSGWCVGEPGGTPVHGTHRFASKGASHEAVFAAAHQWMKHMLEVYEPNVVVWEAPMPTSFNRGKTNADTTSLLFGAPAIVGMTAYEHGVYDIRKASTRDVRLHFIGCSPKRLLAKPMVVRQCRAMGWLVADDNEADAIATWHYMASLIEPKLAVRPTPIFGR